MQMMTLKRLLLVVTIVTCWDVSLNLESPKYTLVKKTDAFEIREYPVMKMAHAEERDLDLYEGKLKTFMKLQRYMSGGNDRKQILNLTFPLIDRVVFGDGCHTVQYYGKDYYIPTALQEDTPTPNIVEDKVEIRLIEARTMCVRAFGGWATRPQILKNLRILENDLKAGHIPFDSREIFVAERSAPWQLENRTNEILLKSTYKVTESLVNALNQPMD